MAGVLLMQEGKKVDTSSREDLYLLTKSRRLCSKKAFDLVFKTGKKIENKQLKVYYLPVPTDGRVAFVAGKWLGRAVLRNFCKRRLREMYRLNQHEISKGYTFILVSKPRLSRDSYQACSEGFMRTLREYELLV